MNGGKERVADYLVVEVENRCQFVAASVETDPEETGIGHRLDERAQGAVAPFLDDLNGLGARPAHFAPLGCSTVKAPVAVATGRSASSSVATARTKATERVM